MKTKSTLFCLVLALCANTSITVYAQAVNKQDSLALVDLYNSTNGPNWNTNTNWLTGPVSTWYGITVTGTRVTGIDLHNSAYGDNNLSGSIPSSLGNLVNLNYLNLDRSQLSGIPSSLGNLVNLSSLSLFNCGLSGSIPSSFGNLVNLSSLDLSFNQLSGTIPSSIGNLVNLNYLDLFNNQLSGSIPSSLGNLVNLSSLNLPKNELSDSIPSSIGNLVNLNYLNLNDNQLSGSIPSSLGNLVNLSYLDLSSNQLSDSIPTSLENLSNLDLLDLANNNFTFNGMELIAQKFSFATYSHQGNIPVHQNDNALSVSAGGTLSNNSYKWFMIGQTGSVTITGDSVFHPSQNGKYFASVTNSVATKLILHTDTINYAQTVNKQDSLALVDLYNSTNGPNWKHNHNWLTSRSVSRWIGVTVTGTRVTGLLLENNNLTGSIPSSFGNLVNLFYLYLNNNQLSGAIPSSFGNLVNLSNLYLNNNQLSGAIPSEIGNLNLGYLFLNNNQLSGSIPVSIGNLVSIHELRLSNNQLTDTIPSSIGNLVTLYSLSLFDNKLSGSIPSSIGNLVNLQNLNLSHNKLSGKIPSTITNLQALSQLNLSYNNFTFDGMGLVAITFPFAIYRHQAPIPVHQNGGALSVSAGSILSYNTYEWFHGNTLIATIAGDSVFHPSEKGTYHVRVSNSLATKLTLRSDTIHHAPPDEFAGSASAFSFENAMQQHNKTNLFFVYPNPAKDILHVQTSGKATLSLTDQSGKILFTRSINGKDEINVSNLAAGLYYLRNNETGAVQKVIITK